MAVNRTTTRGVSTFCRLASHDTLVRMSGSPIEALAVTAAEARDHVAELEAERALAFSAGLADVDLYMQDLDAEIELWRHEYVAAAVTEIATLRGALFGANSG
jgi:hypothetical protein